MNPGRGGQQGPSSSLICQRRPGGPAVPTASLLREAVPPSSPCVQGSAQADATRPPGERQRQAEELLVRFVVVDLTGNSSGSATELTPLCVSQHRQEDAERAHCWPGPCSRFRISALREEPASACQGHYRPARSQTHFLCTQGSRTGHRSRRELSTHPWHPCVAAPPHHRGHPVPRIGTSGLESQGPSGTPTIDQDPRKRSMASSSQRGELSRDGGLAFCRLNRPNDHPAG